MIMKAFPIMVFLRKDDDGVRRIAEVFEPTHISEGQVKGNTIFRFRRDSTKEDENGRVIEVIGEFEQCDSISRRLYHMLIQNGAKKDALENVYRPDEAYIAPGEE